MKRDYAGMGYDHKELENFKIQDDLQERIDELEPDAQRYRALKQKIEYFCDDGGMRRATLDWCVEVNSLSPETLDEAIDQIILKK